VLKHLSHAFKAWGKRKRLSVARHSRSLVDVYKIHACGKDPD